MPDRKLKEIKKEAGKLVPEKSRKKVVDASGLQEITEILRKEGIIKIDATTNVIKVRDPDALLNKYMQCLTEIKMGIADENSKKMLQFLPNLQRKIIEAARNETMDKISNHWNEIKKGNDALIGDLWEQVEEKRRGIEDDYNVTQKEIDNFEAQQKDFFAKQEALQKEINNINHEIEEEITKTEQKLKNVDNGFKNNLQNVLKLTPENESKIPSALRCFSNVKEKILGDPAPEPDKIRPMFLNEIKGEFDKFKQPENWKNDVNIVNALNDAEKTLTTESSKILESLFKLIPGRSQKKKEKNESIQEYFSTVSPVIGKMFSSLKKTFFQEEEPTEEPEGKKKGSIWDDIFNLKLKKS